MNFLKYVFSICFIFCLVLVNAQDDPKKKDIYASKFPKVKTEPKKSGDPVKIESDSKKSSSRKKASEMYDDLWYKASTEQYQDARSDGAYSFSEMAEIANSYRLNHETEDAEYWYARVVKDTREPVHYYYYAQMLYSNDKCEDAIRWYQEYFRKADKKSKIGREFIKECEEIYEFKDNPRIKLTNLNSVNTEHLEFAPMPYKEELVFTSNRGITKSKMDIDKWTNEFFSDLFIGSLSKEGEVYNIRPMEGDINGKHHDGAATFTSSGNMMIFTRNNNKKDKKGYINLKIYTADREGDDWVNTIELPFNSDDYSCAHPTLSKDGRRLYFASDMPGGFGNMDIYVSVFEGGDWAKPRNLGPNINTAGVEIFPFIDENDKLYFASDGHKGLGGLDIFFVNRALEEDENSWTERTNIGTPFNSQKDDFGFVKEEDLNEGYFVSSRFENSQGQDDIFKWNGDETPVEEKPMSRKVCVVDALTGAVIETAEVNTRKTDGSIKGNDDDLYLTIRPLEEDNDEYVLGIKKNGNDAEGENLEVDYLTNEFGQFDMPMWRSDSYYVEVEKAGYHAWNGTIENNKSQERDECYYEIPLERITCLELNGVVVNKKYGKRMPNADVQIFNRCTGEFIELKSDKVGAFNMCLECGCEYDIVANKKLFSGDQTEVSTIGKNCNELVGEQINTKLELEMGGREIDLVAALTPEEVDVKTHLLGDPNKEIKVGDEIRLKHIYYDFDKYYIRKDASIDLDYVVRLMKLYPSLEIELGSHTDCRGSDKYNTWLARKRAKSARKYIVDKGIASSRLTYQGYGEKRLTNDCDDGVDCSEDEHQRNRRTMVRVTRFDRQDVRIIEE